MGREPKASTLNTHNSAMNRVFEEAVARGFIAHKSVPLLVNRGEKSERRPDFTREEYATLIRKLPSWINAGKAGKPTDMRHLMRDYVLIMAQHRYEARHRGAEPQVEACDAFRGERPAILRDERHR